MSSGGDPDEIEWHETAHQRLTRLQKRTHYPNCGHHWARPCDCAAERDIAELLAQTNRTAR